MRFNIISNLTNGVGLQRDYELLRTELKARGHEVQGVQFNAKPLVVPPADVNIFDELVVPAAFAAAKEQWVDIYDRISTLIQAHRTTLVFVNTRRLSERVAHNLRQSLGEEAVASHHGSLSRKIVHHNGHVLIDELIAEH